MLPRRDNVRDNGRGSSLVSNTHGMLSEIYVLYGRDRHFAHDSVAFAIQGIQNTFYTKVFGCFLLLFYALLGRADNMKRSKL